LAIDEDMLISPLAKTLAHLFQDRMKIFEEGYNSEGCGGPDPIDIEDEIVAENPLPGAPPTPPNLPMSLPTNTSICRRQRF
jgi:hypothetical protein